jgi:hypothetical protein
MKSRIDAMDSFDVTLTASDKSRHIVQCERLLRTIAGRRSVFDGVYQGRPVIVKRFEDMFGRFRCWRERRGLKRLSRHGLAAPEVLLAAKDDKGDHVLVIEKIENAVDVLAALESATSLQQAQAILLALIRYVAKMNQSGVEQLDLHAGNFLVSDEVIYAIDAAKLKFWSKPLSMDAGLRQLAMVLTGVPGRYLARENELLQEYCQVRGWEAGSAYCQRLQACKAQRRKAYLTKALKKTLRNSKRFFVLQEQGCRGVFYKEAFDAESARRLMELLKNRKAGDERTFILDFEGRKYEVRQFRPKNKLQALHWRLCGSPARRRWLNEWKAFYSERSILFPVATLEFEHYSVNIQTES